ncbi:MipA/OmpV family protein [Coralloluteibacterium thermophilus]|uniref:MipA/OmpV family protein n=1 Tax=Coralloluteibacterium thermophilum TaxID=2707049 RepID=A0ABV9NIF3_9GAMM
MFRRATALLLVLPFAAAAQTGRGVADQIHTPRSDDWSLGVGVSIRDSAYAGEGTRIRPGPLVTYQGERFFWNGLTGGIHLVRNQSVQLDAILSGRFDGFDIDDLGRAELAANGLDADLLEDRDDALDAGFALTWRGRGGVLAVRALADITDTSGGQEFSVAYGYPIHIGRTTLVPGVAARWMSSDLADYYYGTGTLDGERARGVREYAPGSVVVPRASLGFSRPLGDKWRLLGSLDYEVLPDELADSPLMEPDTDGTARLMIGIARGF